MRKLICLLLFFLLFNIKVNSDEIYPVAEDFEEVFNIGTMLSHDDKFTLYFRTRDKAILAKGEEINYIKDYPQDLYILYNETGKTNPLITHDWFNNALGNSGFKSNRIDLPTGNILLPIDCPIPLRFNLVYNVMMSGNKLEYINKSEFSKIKEMFDYYGIDLTPDM